MTYAESPFWLVCLSGAFGAVVLAIALYRFATFNRADNGGGIRGDVPENATPIDEQRIYTSDPGNHLVGTGEARRGLSQAHQVDRLIGQIGKGGS